MAVSEGLAQQRAEPAPNDEVRSRLMGLRSIILLDPTAPLIGEFRDLNYTVSH